MQGEALDAAYPDLVDAIQGKTTATLTLIRRLAAGDEELWAALDDPLSSVAEESREALLRYLALGGWQGWQLPLPEGSRISPEACILQAGISIAACVSAALGWRTTLLAALRDSDPRPRRGAVTLLGGCSACNACNACNDPCALLAAVKLLGDPDECVRWAAAVALAHHDSVAIEAIPRRLTSSELAPELRHTTA